MREKNRRTSSRGRKYEMDDSKCTLSKCFPRTLCPCTTHLKDKRREKREKQIQAAHLESPQPTPQDKDILHQKEMPLQRIFLLFLIFCFFTPISWRGKLKIPSSE